MVVNVLKNGGEKVFPLYVTQDGEIFTGRELADVAAFKEGLKPKGRRAIVGNGGIYSLNGKGRPKDFVKIDAAVNCCHGGFGEGGGVCGLFEMNGIPLASAGAFESSAFIDKYLTKLVLRSLGVKTASWEYLRSAEGRARCLPLGFPMIVKPVTLGSSIGVEKVCDEEELAAALDCAFIYDDGAIVEEYLSDKRDINCAVYRAGGEIITSECEEAVSCGELLSFEDKYAGGGKSVLPADIPLPVSEEIKKITRNVYEKLNMRGIVRFDFILSGGGIYLSEINTVPGSLSYYLLSKGFKDFYPVLIKLIDEAVRAAAGKGRKRLVTTGILKSVPSGGLKNGIK